MHGPVQLPLAFEGPVRIPKDHDGIGASVIRLMEDEAGIDMVEDFVSSPTRRTANARASHDSRRAAPGRHAVS